MRDPKKRVAILSPIAWRTPPQQYGAWETVAGNITEGLVARDWDVTLFATADSVTRAHLHAVLDRGYEEDSTIDPKVAEYLHISEAFEHAAEFDLIHSHYDFMPLSYTRLIKTPVLTTIHGFSSAKIMPIYQKYRDGYFASVSDSDRATGLNYLATVYNGIDLSLYPLQECGGDDLIFLGRIHPDKGVHLAIEVARLSGMRLIIAGIIQDKAYFREQVQPHLDNQNILYIGPVDVKGKNELFAPGTSRWSSTSLRAMFSRKRYSVARRTADRRFFSSFVIGRETASSENSLTQHESTAARVVYAGLLLIALPQCPPDNKIAAAIPRDLTSL
jgi:glycosyltransferase involved in cell wall biosynthesis